MNFPYPLLPPVLYWLAWPIWLALLGWAMARAPWAVLRDEGRLHLWLGMIVVLILLWSLKAGVQPGLDLHLTGIMVFSLVFDTPLAFLGLDLVLLGITLNGVLAWPAFALNALASIALGLGLAALIRRLVDAVLPGHFFVFVFCKAFFGAALVLIGLGVGAVCLYGLTGIYPWSRLLEDYLPYYLLLGFSEAWLSGMVLTLLLVYRPEWVGTFDPAVYSDQNRC